MENFDTILDLLLLLAGFAAMMIAIFEKDKTEEQTWMLRAILAYVIYLI